MHKFANPTRFFKACDVVYPWTILLSLSALCLGLYFSLVQSPVDYQQGDTVRIMYVHVPAAWMSMMCYLIMALSCGSALIWKHAIAFSIARSTAPIGATFTFLALVTGSLWGKPMGGTWWVWDARLTSVLILFFLYIGFITLYHSFDDRSRGAKAASILALVGAINLPIIKFSVDWWNTLHQPASVVKLSGPAIHTSMLTPLFVMAFAYICFYFWILIIRLKAASNLTKISAFEARKINSETEVD